MPGTRTAATPRTASGRVLTAREAEALRRLLAERAAADGTGPRTASWRPAAGRPVAGQPARRPGPRAAREARKAQRRLVRRRWARRVVVGAAALAVPAVTALLLVPGAAPQAGTAPTDPTSLALTARTTLLDAAGRYQQLAQQVTQRRAELATAERAERDARDREAAERATVGSAAADLYRSSATGRFPVLGTDVADPDGASAVLALQAVRDRADDRLRGAVVRAERTGQTVDTAAEVVADARAAVRAAERRAAAALADVRARAGGLSTDVSLVLAGLGAPALQQERDTAAVHRWQDYLSRLAAAGIEPPPAAALSGADTMPAGFSPALDAQGRPIPGVAWAVIGSSPVTVVSAETVAAVSSALALLGKPYVPGATGPEAYDCGGFTAASWLLAGYALPVSPADQWATGAAVPVDQLQLGDLVVGDGGLDIGLYVGAGEMVSASGRAAAVAVRSVGADVRAVRVTLPAPATANAALTPAAGMGACGVPLPSPTAADPAWGGYANGRIPASALCRLGGGGHSLRCDAAASYRAMSDAFAGAFGTPLCITDSYRSYAGQVAAYRAKPRLAAWPGTSNHGWALAVDLCGGINVAGSAQWRWMQANAGRFGFVNPPWARPGSEKPEPWHWEYGVLD